MSASITRTQLTWTFGYRAAINSGAFTSDVDGNGDPYTYVDELTYSLAPALSRARLSRDYTLVVSPGASTSRAVVPALDLRGQQVKITITDGTNTLTWYGYVPQISEQVNGSSSVPVATPASTPETVHKGNSSYIAYGLEYHLTEVLMYHSFTSEGYISEIIPFNYSVAGGGIQGNRSAAKAVDRYTFDPSNTDTWSAMDVAEYLVGEFNSYSGQSWTLGGQYASLATTVETWEFRHGQSLFAALNEVIHPRNGFTWYLTKTGDAAEPVIYVVSTADAAYSAGDITIPANANVVELSLHQSSFIEEATYHHVENAHYDTIIARGGPIRVAFTMDPADGSLAIGWDAADETAYNAAADDDARQQSRYRSVYRDFIVPAAWDGTVNAINCLPVLDTSDEATPLDLTTSQTLYFRDLRLDPITPLQDGTSDPPRWRPPLVIMYDTANTRYIDLTSPPDGVTPVGVSILDDRPGVRMHTRFGHQLGADDFGGTSDFTAEFDWRDMLVTVMIPTNERLEWSETAADATPGPLERRLYIDVPEAELWFLPEDTVTGTNTDGSDVTRVANPGTVVRNDLATLKRVAQSAALWYGRRRTKLDVRYSHGFLVVDGSGNHRLGHVISETHTGSSTQPTGTIISRVTYRLGTRQTSEFSTDFLDLDLQGLARKRKYRQPGRGGRMGHGARPDYRPASTEAPPQVIVPPAPGSGASGTNTVPVQITASTDYNTYTASVYGAGWNAAATETGVTLEIGQIAVGETVPNGTRLLAVKVGSTYYGQVPVCL